jgi:hypothetical protein
MKIKKFNESTDFNLTEPKKLVYFDLFPLLRGLERIRPGIKDRVWEFLCEEKDASFKPIKGRILNINLYYFGIGDEYPTNYLKEYPQELEHSKKTFPKSYIDGNIEKELRLDFNLIISKYEDHIEDIGSFSVMCDW